MNWLTKKKSSKPSLTNLTKHLLKCPAIKIQLYPDQNFLLKLNFPGPTNFPFLKRKKTQYFSEID